VLAKLLHSVVGVGDSDGDHAADQLDLFPDVHRLATYQLLALSAYDGGTLSFTLSPTKVLASKPQPRFLGCNAAQIAQYY